MRGPHLLALAAALAAAAGADESAIAPKFLWTASEASTPQVVCDAGVSWKADGGKFVLSVEGGDASWPGLSVRPAAGAWDLSPWGHVEAVLTNPGDKPLSVGLRVDNPGDWKLSPWNGESVYLKPGETKTGKVIFGYQHGFKKGYRLDPSRVTAVKIFLNGKSAERRALLVGDVLAAGAAGEMPPVDPSRVVVKPAGGVIPGAPLAVAVAKRGDAAWLKPKSGYWNLGDWLKVTATVRNTGAVPVTPTMAVDSSGGRIAADAAGAVAPGATATLVARFIPKEPWRAVGDGRDVKPTGGTKFESHRVRGFLFGAAEARGEYEVVSVRAEKVVAETPGWLGTRPPVPGKWVRTLSEEFDAGTLDETVWSPYASNYWDKRTHFTRENILFRDGCAVLRYEKKRGPKNDDPALGETDYACGILNSHGKWTQRYGYFEARMKLPRAPGLWPAFWTMPDRGPETPGEAWRRNDTHDGGMEFDIMEHLTAWGPHRFNAACHWDGYGKDHRAIGTTGVYMAPDAEGFITVGMLWLPGVWAIYGNGVELARWESGRVSDVPAHVFFYMVSGGWANEPLDDDELPDEFAIDWFRAWQREDLAAGPAPGTSMPALSTYRWGTGGCEKGLYDQWEQWVGCPVWAEDFMPKESWDKIEGEAWQLGVWSKWRTLAPGRRLVLSVPMLVGPWNRSGPKTGPGASEPVSLEKGAAGEYDEHFAALGRNLVKWGLADTIVRLGWEFNGGWYTYRVENEKDARDFAAFFRRAVAAMRAAEGQRFLFCWNPAMEPWWSYDVEAAWPGDDVVDVIGIDVYDQSWVPDTYPIPEGASPEERRARQGRAWERKTGNEGAFGLPWWPKFAARHGGKPLAVCEWGVCHREDGHGGGDDPLYIERMADFILDPANNVLFHCYFDVGADDGDHLIIPDGRNETRFPESSRAFHRRFAAPGAAYVPPPFQRIW